MWWKFNYNGLRNDNIGWMRRRRRRRRRNALTEVLVACLSGACARSSVRVCVCSSIELRMHACTPRRSRLSIIKRARSETKMC